MIIPKKSRIAAVLSLTAVLMAFGAGYTHENQKTMPVSASSPPRYLVKEYMGMVAVFTGDEKIVDVTDSPVAALPERDRLILKEGIAVDDDTELAMLLEDYTS